MVESLKAQTGFPLGLAPGEELRSRRVTLHEKKLVPFWSALDRLGSACGVRYIPRVAFSPEPRDPTIMLHPGGGPPVPTSDSGPFRVHLVSLSRSRKLAAVRPPGQATIRETLLAKLHVLAEPGLAMSPTGSVVLEEAVDDRGADIRPEFPVGSAPSRPRPHFEEGNANLFALTLTLSPAASPGTILRRLKGRVPIEVLTRTGDPIVVPVGDTKGSTFGKSGITLSISGLSRTGENTSFRLTINDNRPDRQASTDPPPALGAYRPPYAIEDHVQVLDDQGQPLWWNAAPLLDLGDGKRETVISLHPAPGKTPTRILYHGVVGAVTELTFEFRDMTLP